MVDRGRADQVAVRSRRGRRATRCASPSLPEPLADPAPGRRRRRSLLALSVSSFQRQLASLDFHRQVWCVALKGLGQLHRSLTDADYGRSPSARWVILRAGGGRQPSVTASVGSKTAKQMGQRGWSHDMIDDTIAHPARTVPTRDVRFNPDGSRNDDPATAYINKDGSYVVRNDRTGDVVQISNRNDPNWKSPW